VILDASLQSAQAGQAMPIPGLWIALEDDQVPQPLRTEDRQVQFRRFCRK